MEKNKGDIRYDRQERIIGVEAMELLKKQKILLCGLGGLGAEVAKNIILMGVQSITLADDKKASNHDLSSQFILNEESIGKSRLTESLNFLKTLNDACDVTAYEGKVTLEYISQFTVVIYTDTPITSLTDIADMCHKAGIKFVASQAAGLFGTVFVDFVDFVSNDIGLPECSGMISTIKVDKDGNAEVDCEDTDNQEDHNMTDEYSVVFQNVGGLDINGKAPRKIERTGPYTFKIGSVKDLGTYTTGGYFTSVPVQRKFAFKTLAENLEDPCIQMNNFFTDNLNFIGFVVLGKFISKFGRYPKPYSIIDADEFLHLAKEINDRKKFVDCSDSDKKHLTYFSYTCSGNLNPMTTYLGALVAQEALKGATHKYQPIQQFFFFDSLETLPNPLPQEEDWKK
jgi:ubiquitin-activating enzyme E1